MRKPKPVVVETRCSECDLPWEDHGDNPTLLDCIRLLKEQPKTVTYTYPWYQPYPYQTPTITWGGGAGGGSYIWAESDGNYGGGGGGSGYEIGLGQTGESD